VIQQQGNPTKVPRVWLSPILRSVSGFSETKIEPDKLNQKTLFCSLSLSMFVSTVDLPSVSGEGNRKH
jgi:hypothetical protein